MCVSVSYILPETIGVLELQTEFVPSLILGRTAKYDLVVKLIFENDSLYHESRLDLHAAIVSRIG